jgi:hypothetical protein
MLRSIKPRKARTGPPRFATIYELNRQSTETRLSCFGNSKEEPLLHVWLVSSRCVLLNRIVRSGAATMSRRSSATSGSAAARLSRRSLLDPDLQHPPCAPGCLSLLLPRAERTFPAGTHVPPQPAAPACRPSLPPQPGSPCQGSPCLALMTGREHFLYARTAPTRNAHCRSDDRPPPPPLTPARALSHCCAPRTTA